MKYTIDKGKIISPNGIPYLPRWFCDDLVTFEIDKYGISKVEYFNRKTKGTEKIFLDDMWGGMRFYINENGYHSSQKPEECEIMPYGFKAKWKYKNSVFYYEQRVVNNSICIFLKPVDLKHELDFDIEFYDSWRLIPHTHGDGRYVSNIERVWSDWEFSSNTLTSHCIDDNENGTYVTFKCSEQAELIRRKIGFYKNILSVNIKPDCQIVFVMSFDDNEVASLKRANHTLENYALLCGEQNTRYQAVMDKSPVLESPYKVLNDFFALAPLYHESCKIPSVPGGVHAKTEHYWIWGWDGMTSNFSYAYWDDVEFMGDMLKLYMDTADKEKGIGHFFARDMSHKETSMISAQGFYICLLYQYYVNGGDIEPYYEFAKWIFELIISTEEKGTGLCKGYSLIPDLRDTILETGNDLSGFNNSVSYCAVCSIREIAKAIGDDDTYLKATSFADRMKENYAKILFDEEKGFFVSSADAETLEKRPVYMSPVLKWDNLFCYDLIKDRQKKILSFMENNVLCECGLPFAPVWDIGYDADANQMHCYWPAHSETFTRLANFENRKDLLEKFIGWIECWTNILMCPEGIDCYDNINEPKPDGWNAVNGTWQAYSLRAWYEAVVHSVFGIDFDGNGMNIYPYEGEEMSITNLHFAGKTFDIYMKGSGTSVKDVVLNGESIGSVMEIKMDKFNKSNVIEIIRE